jgi:hypothetical protein
MAAYPRYQVGRDFNVMLTVPELAPTEYLVAELMGPLDDDDAPETALRTSEDQREVMVMERDRYVLRGPVPQATPLGTYGLIRLFVHDSAGRHLPSEVPPDFLPPTCIVIEA